MNREATNGSWFLSALLLLFVGLKLAGIGVVADWSWWWVLSPIWIPASLALVVLLFAVLFVWRKS